MATASTVTSNLRAAVRSATAEPTPAVRLTVAAQLCLSPDGESRDRRWAEDAARGLRPTTLLRPTALGLSATAGSSVVSLTGPSSSEQAVVEQARLAVRHPPALGGTGPDDAEFLPGRSRPGAGLIAGCPLRGRRRPGRPLVYMHSVARSSVGEPELAVELAERQNARSVRVARPPWPVRRTPPLSRSAAPNREPCCSTRLRARRSGPRKAAGCERSRGTRPCRPRPARQHPQCRVRTAKVAEKRPYPWRTG